MTRAEPRARVPSPGGGRRATCQQVAAVQPRHAAAADDAVDISQEQRRKLAMQRLERWRAV